MEKCRDPLCFNLITDYVSQVTAGCMGLFWFSWTYVVTENGRPANIM